MKSKKQIRKSRRIRRVLRSSKGARRLSKGGSRRSRRSRRNNSRRRTRNKRRKNKSKQKGGYNGKFVEVEGIDIPMAEEIGMSGLKIPTMLSKIYETSCEPPVNHFMPRANN